MCGIEKWRGLERAGLISKGGIVGWGPFGRKPGAEACVHKTQLGTNQGRRRAWPGLPVPVPSTSFKRQNPSSFSGRPPVNYRNRLATCIHILSFLCPSPPPRPDVTNDAALSREGAASRSQGVAGLASSDWPMASGHKGPPVSLSSCPICSSPPDQRPFLQALHPDLPLRPRPCTTDGLFVLVQWSVIVQPCFLVCHSPFNCIRPLGLGTLSELNSLLACLSSATTTV